MLVVLLPQVLHRLTVLRLPWLLCRLRRLEVLVQLLLRSGTSTSNSDVWGVVVEVMVLRRDVDTG